MRKIIMTRDDATALALQALVWILDSEDRTQRFLSLTGLDADGLRGSAADPATHVAILDYLAGHEPDLVACAQALDETAENLMAAQQLLSGEGDWG